MAQYTERIAKVKSQVKLFLKLNLEATMQKFFLGGDKRQQLSIKDRKIVVISLIDDFLSIIVDAILYNRRLHRL